MGDAVVAVAMAVAVCAIVLVPLFLLAALARRWIQRAPTDKSARLRRRAFWVCLVAALVVWEYREAIADSKLWRRASGTCVIALVNNSGVEVKDLELATRASGDPESSVSHDDSMGPNSRRWIKTRADEFKVERFTGTVSSNRFSFVGTAKKGERLVITIEAGGRIVTRVE